MQIPSKIRREFVIVIVIIAIAIVAFLVLGWLSNSNGDSYASGDLEVQSSLEMEETNLTAQISGEVKEVYAEEGDVVKKGQLLAVIDDADLQIKKTQAEAGIETIQGQIKGAQASLSGAEAQFTQVQEGTRQEELLQLKSKYDLAESLYQKKKLLFEQGAISQVDFDSVVSDRDIKKAQYEVAVKGAKNSERKAAQAGVSGAVASVESLEGQLKSAQSSLSEIELQLEKTKLIAPAAGVLSQWSAKEGELVTSGSKIATVTDDKNPWVECSIKETQLSKVKEGQQVNIRFGAYEGKQYKGTIVSINKSADFATKRATNESGSFDIKAYGVKVELEQTDLPLYAGMTVFVTFQK